MTAELTQGNISLCGILNINRREGEGKEITNGCAFHQHGVQVKYPIKATNFSLEQF